MKKLALLQILFVLSIALSQDGLLKIELSKNVDIVVERSSKDDPFNSIKITKDKEEILKLEDNKIFIANTFEVVYEGYDGAIAPNNSMSLLDFNNLDNVNFPYFKFPNYNGRIIGIVQASAGASGGGAQSFYLINIDTGQWTVISNIDMLTPKWYNKNGVFGYIEIEDVYIGPHNFPWGEKKNKLINSIKSFNKRDFVFEEEKNKLNELYKIELSKVELTNSDFDSLDCCLLEYFQHDWDDAYAEDKDTQLDKFIKYVYYSKKLNQQSILEKKLYPLLDESLLEELKYIAY